MEDRILENYYGETTEIITQFGTDNIYETLASFELNERFNIVFKGWDSSQDFRTYNPSNANYRKAFNPLFADLTEPEKNQLLPVKNKVLEILRLDSGYWTFSGLMINAENLTAILQARHLEYDNCFATLQIFDSIHFNQLKSANLELFQQMTQFSWVYGKTRNAFLASLTPVQNAN